VCLFVEPKQRGSEGHVPKLVILGALRIIERLPESAASEIDGCIPMPLSPDVSIGTLQQIPDGNFKILVHEAASRAVIALPPCHPLGQRSRRL
jgi:hypothetical protein